LPIPRACLGGSAHLLGRKQIVRRAPKGPQALIKDLNLARSLGEGENVMLEGSAFSPETGSIDSGDLVWTSNLD